MNPLASPEAWDLVSETYVRDTLPFFERYARAALDLAMLGSERKLLDVAAGPGTLALIAEQRGHHVTAVDFAPAMLAQLRLRMAALEAPRIVPELGDGQALRYEEASFDAAFSLFGLMFFSDRAAGFRELRRVIKPAGRALVSAWTQAERVPAIRALYNAIRGVMTGLAFGDGEAPLGTPAAMRAEMAAAGFRDVVVQEVSFEKDFADVPTFWASMVRGSIPLVALRGRLGEREWPAFSEQACERFAREVGDGPVVVRWPAILGMGSKAA
jgi:SAM-dependent methyltransferase